MILDEGLVRELLPSEIQTSQDSSARTCEFLLVVAPRTSMTGLALFIDCLRAVNRISGSELFRWTIATVEGRTVEASNGFPIPPNCSLAEAKPCSRVVVFASYEPSGEEEQLLAIFLRRAARFGSELIAIDQASVLFAKLGLLDGYRATSHWEVLPSLAERFPDVTFSADVFVCDRNRTTCAGHTACLDLALHLTESLFGKALAMGAASELIYDRMRSASQPQRELEPSLRVSLSAPVGRAIALMTANLAEPRSIAAIAAASGLSTRQLECHFQTYLKVSPQRYYLLLRLAHARKLLLYSSMRIGEVSMACGFSSQGSLTRAFNGEYAATPTAYRRRYLDSQDRPFIAHL